MLDYEVEPTSIAAYRRAIESGYIKKARLAVYKAYCDYFEYVKNSDPSTNYLATGVTSNEIQQFIWESKHESLAYFDKRKINHINKIQAPLRQMNLLRCVGTRLCTVKGTEAKIDVLITDGPVYKIEVKPSKDAIIRQLRNDIEILEEENKAFRFALEQVRRKL